MKKSNKIILIVLIVVAIVACTLMFVLRPTSNENTEKTHETQTAEQTNEAVDDSSSTENDENINGLDKPIFMYFVTNADLKNETTASALEKLQSEYADRVIFDIKNADEEPELYDNFPLELGMPALIMQKKGGDISNFLFANNDYEQLKAAIEVTLQ